MRRDLYLYLHLHLIICMNDMPPLVSPSYLADSLAAWGFSCSSCSSSSHCIQLQLLWRLLYVAFSTLLLALYLSLCSHCAYFVLRFLRFFLYFLMHTRRRIACFSFFFLSLLAFHLPRSCCCCCCVCIFFAIFFLHLLCFVRFVLLRWISTCQTSIKRMCVCVCRNAMSAGRGRRRSRRRIIDGRVCDGGGRGCGLLCYQIGCCTLLHFSAAAISNWLGMGLVSS